MRRWLAITAVGAALVATSVSAQMRGGGGAHGGGARTVSGSAPVGRGGFMPHSAPRFSPTPMNHGTFVGGGFHTSFHGHGGRFPHHPPVFFPHHHPSSFFFGFRRFGNFGYYPGYYSYYPSYYPDTYNTSNDSNGDQNYQIEQELSQLSAEVRQLREEQADRSAPPAPPQSAPQPVSNAIPTALVLRNGKTLDVDNYAIAGGTIWVFTKQGRRKIPLSEVNISGTQKANEERGVPFEMPDTP